MSSLALGFSISGMTCLGGPSQPVLPQLELTTTAGVIEIQAVGSLLELTIANTGIYDGNYVIDPAELASGPLLLMGPSITGTPAVGETLSIVPGLWLYEQSDPAPTVEHRWQVAAGGGTFADVPGATTGTYVVPPADAGRQIRLTETATGTAGARTANSAPIDVAALPSAFSVTRIGDFRYLAASTATPTFAIDTSALAAGDILIVFYGTNLEPSAATLNGNPMTKAAGNGATTTSSRMAAFVYTLTAGDLGASASFVATISGNRANHQISVHAVRNGSPGSWATDHGAPGPALTGTVTPSSAANVVLACWMGGTDAFPIVWTNATEIDSENTGTSARGISVASVANVPLSPLAVAADPGNASTSNSGLIVVAVNGA